MFIKNIFRASVIHIEPFSLGMAPCIIMNDTKIPIVYSQKGSKSDEMLWPNEMSPFKWVDMVNLGKFLHNIFVNDHRTHIGMEMW